MAATGRWHSWLEGTYERPIEYEHDRRMWTTVNMSAADSPHEFVVAPELAEVAERLGVPLHAGDRVRFEVIDGDGADTPRRRRLSWLGSVSTGEHTLSERAKDDIRTGIGQEAD